MLELPGFCKSAAFLYFRRIIVLLILNFTVIAISATVAFAAPPNMQSHKLEKHINTLIELDKFDELKPLLISLKDKPGIPLSTRISYLDRLIDCCIYKGRDDSDSIKYLDEALTIRSRLYKNRDFKLYPELELRDRLCFDSVRKARAQININDLRGALTTLDRGLEIYKDADGIYTLRAKLNKRMKKYDAAIADWTRTLEIQQKLLADGLKRGSVKNAMNSQNGIISALYERASNYEAIGKHVEGKKDRDRADKLTNDL